jgi:hypothetical protein
MGGMKYSAGFEDPPARPKVQRSRTFKVAAAVLATAAVGATFAAYLSPSVVDLESLMLLLADALRIR